MRFNRFPVFLVVLGLAWCSCMEDDTRVIDPVPPIDRVNPFIGSGGQYFGVGSGFVGASVPFGMAKPGPNTEGPFDFHHCSGYHYDDLAINGFGQVHIHGMGAPDYGALLFMPTIGFGAGKIREAGYRSGFTKETETSSPGYYAVVLDDTGIRAELTASLHGAVHRYTYPEGAGTGHVIIDLSHAILGCHVSESRVEIDADAREVSGRLRYHGSLTGRSGGLVLYFSAVFDRDFEGWTLWQEQELREGALLAEGVEAGAAMEIRADTPVEVAVGISYVDVAGARNNRETELAGRDFDAVHQAARDAWSSILESVRVEGGTEDQRVMFATALYHVMLTPTVFTDADGRFTGFDKQVHQADDFLFYSDFSMWDTYRTVHSLFNLVIADRQRDMVVSLLKMYEHGGHLPRWPAGTGYGGSMIGTPADIIISESYLKGIRDFDAGMAYAAIKENATTAMDAGGRDGIEHYMQLGYVPADSGVSGASAKTLEYANADAAVAAFARVLGRDQDAVDFTSRSRNHRHLFDPVTQFMRGKNEDGTWAEPDEEFNPLDWNAPYFVEGDAWQYTFLVPQDPAGLIDLFPGPDAFVDKLEAFFSTPEPEDDLSEFLPKRYYWHGNEPDIHAAYLFNDAGRPERTQYWARHVLATRYGTGPDGLAGNDDLGTLSAWYVFSASGFYPVAGLEKYWLGSPLFERITFQLGGGKTLEIVAEGASTENLYIQSARLNGEDLQVPWFTHADIAEGGILELTLGPQPSEWGR